MKPSEALKLHRSAIRSVVEKNDACNPLIWMLEVNGFTVDARHLPLEVQDIAYAKGLIPYVPARKAEQS